jgi:hypothetical protein
VQPEQLVQLKPLVLLEPLEPLVPLKPLVQPDRTTNRYLRENSPKKIAGPVPAIFLFTERFQESCIFLTVIA